MKRLNNRTCISLHRDTYKKLKQYGQTSESMDKVVNRILTQVTLDKIALDIVNGGETR